MRHATWTAIEANPIAMRFYRFYGLLPEEVRVPARWLVAPRWHAACSLVRRRTAGTVFSGPFSDMRIKLSPVSQRYLLGYLLGTQELELHPVIEAAIARQYGTVINIGAGDGYYTVGLARRMPAAHVIGFEGLEAHHALIRLTAKLNGVSDRVSLRGFCTCPELQRALLEGGPRPFVLCDIEGGEKELLDNDKIPELNTADILVETHDGLMQGCRELMIQRFCETHDIKSIVARPRSLADFPSELLPALPKWLPDTTVELMNERRTGIQEWLFMTARRTSKPAKRNWAPRP